MDTWTQEFCLYTWQILEWTDRDGYTGALPNSLRFWSWVLSGWDWIPFCGATLPSGYLSSADDGQPHSKSRKKEFFINLDWQSNSTVICRSKTCFQWLICWQSYGWLSQCALHCMACQYSLEITAHPECSIMSASEGFLGFHTTLILKLFSWLLTDFAAQFKVLIEEYIKLYKSKDQGTYWIACSPHQILGNQWGTFCCPIMSIQCFILMNSWQDSYHRLNGHWN